MDFNEKFIEELIGHIVRNSCPAKLEEIAGMELEDCGDNCEPCEERCKECWKLASEQWMQDN